MKYDSGSIVALSGREHIRKRPSMYVGSVTKYGTHYALIELLQTLCYENRVNTEIILDLSEEIVVLKFKNSILNTLMAENPENTLKLMTAFGILPDSCRSMNIMPAFTHLTSHYRLSANETDIIQLKDDAFVFTPLKTAPNDWVSIHFKMDDSIFDEINLSREILRIECEKLAALCSNIQIQLIDNRNTSMYDETFKMEGGLLEFFKKKIEILDSLCYHDWRWTPGNHYFHSITEYPDLTLELIFTPEKRETTFEKTYYQLLDLSEGGTHVTYFKKRIAELNAQLNKEIQSYDNELTAYNLMTNIVTEKAFSFVGPSKRQIEDPILAQVMDAALHILEPEIISYYQRRN